MICLIGKTASGKTVISKILEEKYGYHGIVTYTTRPPRKGEIQDVSYHFISDEEFLKKIKTGFFAEWKSYNSIAGTWYYGSAKEDLEKADDKTVVILTPDGYRDIKYTLSKKPICIYVYANGESIRNRLSKRGDDEKEIERRIRHDNEDFSDAQFLADRIIYNNNDYCIELAVMDILNFIYKKGEK